MVCIATLRRCTCMQCNSKHTKARRLYSRVRHSKHKFGESKRTNECIIIMGPFYLSFFLFFSQGDMLQNKTNFSGDFIYDQCYAMQCNQARRLLFSTIQVRPKNNYGFLTYIYIHTQMDPSLSFSLEEREKYCCITDMHFMIAIAMISSCTYV